MPFRDVVGHARIVALLARSVGRHSLPPSLILAGPAGVGKRLVALSAAQALNCLNPVTLEKASGSPRAESRGDTGGGGFDACGACAACTRIQRGVHPDVLVVEPGDSGSIKIEQVRDLVDRAAYRPFEGRRRVVIIDEADALVPAAQNALLKTLEEPPASSVFMLVTSRPDALLPTVRSRCPRLSFRPLSTDDIARALELRDYTSAEARAVAATADGSLARALETSAGDVVGAREVAQEVLAYAAGAQTPSQRIEGAKALLVKTSNAPEREQVSTHLRAMASLLRDLEILSIGADPATLANADVRPALERLSRSFDRERGLRAFAAVDRALVALERNAGVKVVADWLLLQI